MLKKTLSCAIISLVLLGSAVLPSAVEAAPKHTQLQSQSQSIMNQYQKLISTTKEAANIIKFLDQNIAKVNRQQADSMILKLEAFYQSDLERTQNQFFQPGIQEKLQKSYNWKTKKLVTKDTQLQKLVATKLAGKYKLTTEEGSVFPIVDYGALKKYSSYLSGEVKDYIALKALESDKPWLSDAAIIISLDELAARTIAGETYLTKYPQSKAKKDATNIYLEYLDSYLYGMNNTPAFDFDTYRLRTNVLTSFNKTIKTYPNSVTAKVVQGYVNVLKKHNYQVFIKDGLEQKSIPEVEAFKKNVHQQALQELAKKQTKPSTVTNRDATAVIENASEFEAFFKKVQQLAAKGDKAGVAGYVAYPIQVKINGKKVTITTKEQFIKRYDQIFNNKVKNALKNQKVDQTFVNYRGVMVGDGELWFNVSLKNQHQFFITSINN
jgi:hypothetical protein